MMMTMTTEEVQALLELAGRAPMSRVEALWFEAVVQRWNDSQRKLAESTEIQDTAPIP